MLARSAQVRIVVMVLVACAGVLLGAPTAALAGETVDAGYSMTTTTFPDGRTYACDGWSGGSDGEGNFYLPCGNWIYELNPDGGFVTAIATPGIPAYRDVAVTTDGSTIYYVSGTDDIDNPHPADGNTGQVVRIARQPDGSWVRQPQVYPYPETIGMNPWAARNLDVDEAGNLYVSVANFVDVFTPQGVRVKRFGGDPTQDAGGNYIGGLQTPQGIAATRDGQHVYVVEQRWNHVQRWDRTPGGDWVHSTWRVGGLGTVSDCADDNTFASPYDVGLDGGGNVYVMDTTCRRLQKYDANGTFRGTIWQNYPVGQSEHLYHGIAVNWRGNVAINMFGRFFRQLAPTPGGCLPDGDAPTIVRIATDAVTYGRVASVRLSVKDGCSGVPSMKVTGDVATAGAWQPLTGTFKVQLTGVDGGKQISVQVRDAHGHVSTVATAVTRQDTTVPPLSPRLRMRLAGRAGVCAPQPLRMLANARQYVLADGCATIGGRVLRIVKRGSTRLVLLRLDSRSARKMYVNPRRAADIWVVGSTKTRTGKRLRVGARATVTASLLVDRRTRTVSAAPTWYWSRR